MRFFSILTGLGAALLCASTASAQSTPISAGSNSALSYECALSGSGGGNLAGCPNNSTGGYETTTTAVTGNNAAANITCNSGNPITYCGARSDSNSTAVAPIDTWSLCRWVDNNSVNSLFVPFRTSLEWQAFLNAKLPGITLTTCGEPYAETGAPATASVTPPYTSSGCTSVTVNNPNVYGRTGTSLWPVPALSQSFTCHGGATTITSQLQWMAGDADGYDSGELNYGQLSWTPANQFSPDLTLLVADETMNGTPSISITANTGDTLTLTWTVAGATGCAASSSDNSWTSNPQPDDGSTTVTSTATGGKPTTYTLTCIGADNLSSTASVTVNDAVAGSCGTANGAGGSSPPTTNLCSSGTPSAVTGNNPWNWTCSGSSTANCSTGGNGMCWGGSGWAAECCGTTAAEWYPNGTTINKGNMGNLTQGGAYCYNGNWLRISGVRG